MNKYSSFFTALKRLPGMSKEEAVYDFTQGRTRSLRQLTTWEVQELTRKMRLLSGEKPINTIRPTEPDPRKKMVNKVIFYGHEMGLISQEAGKKNYTRFHQFIEQKGYLKKRLKDYTFEELPKLVSQMENIYKDYLKKL